MPGHRRIPCGDAGLAAEHPRAPDVRANRFVGNEKLFSEGVSATMGRSWVTGALVCSGTHTAPVRTKATSMMV